MVAENQDPSTDLGRLSHLIDLPAEPENVLWQTRTLGKTDGSVPGPTDWELVAIIKFDQEAIKKIESQLSAAFARSEVDVIKDFIEPQFPQSVGDSILKEVEIDSIQAKSPRYSPEMFTRSPLLHGYVLILSEQRLVFVHLGTT